MHAGDAAEGPAVHLGEGRPAGGAPPRQREVGGQQDGGNFLHGAGPPNPAERRGRTADCTRGCCGAPRAGQAFWFGGSLLAADLAGQLPLNNTYSREKIFVRVAFELLQRGMPSFCNISRQGCGNLEEKASLRLCKMYLAQSCFLLTSEHTLQTVEALMEMDVIACRAKHAAWLSGVRPVFRSFSPSERLVHLPGNLLIPCGSSSVVTASL